jgi:O-antigen/teichoic acid export membrane protein
MSIVRSLVGYAPAVVLPRLVSLVLVVVLTRLMPVDQYGLFTLVMVSGEAIDGIVSNWVRIGLGRFGGGHPETIGPESARCGRLHLATSLVAVLVALPVGLWLGRGRMLGFLVALLLYLAAIATVRFASTVMAARGDRNGIFAVEIGRALAMLSTGVACAVFVSDDFVSVSVASSAVVVLVGLWGLRRTLGDLDFARPPLSEPTGAVLAYALPMIPASIISQTLASADRFVLDAVAGPAAVALYAAAVVLARQPMEFLFTLANVRVFAELMESYERDGPVIAGRRLGDLAAGMALVTFPAAVGLWLVAEPMARLFLAPAYLDTARLVMPWAIAGAVCSGFKLFVFDQVFHMVRASWLNATNAVPAGLLGLVALALLVPRFGILGAAIAFFVQYAVLLATTVAITRTKLPFVLPWSDLARIALATLGMAAAIVAVAPFVAGSAAAIRLVVLIATGIVAYAGLVLVLRPGPVLEILPRAR